MGGRVGDAFSQVRDELSLAVASPEQTFKEEFEVLAEVVGTGQLAYCPIQDLRDEGFTAQQVSDLRLSRPTRCLNLQLQYVAAPRHRAHDGLRVVAERTANVDEALGYGVFRDDGARPDRVEQLVAADEPPLVLDQVAQHIVGLRPDLYFRVVPEQAATVHVERELAEPENTVIAVNL